MWLYFYRSTRSDDRYTDTVSHADVTINRFWQQNISAAGLYESAISVPIEPLIDSGVAIRIQVRIRISNIICCSVENIGLFMTVSISIWPISVHEILSRHTSPTSSRLSPSLSSISSFPSFFALPPPHLSCFFPFPFPASSPIKGLEERCKLPHGGGCRAPAAKAILAYLKSMQ